MAKRPRVCHVITGLDRAGAQRVLADLLAFRDRSRFETEVVTLRPRTGLADEIEGLGVPVWSANMQRGPSMPLRWAGLARRWAARPPDLVHTWMYHGDVIGGVTAKLVHHRTPIVWHLHHTTLDFDRFRMSTRMLAKAGAGLSFRLPARILACADSARRIHVDAGYDPSKMVVVRNGVDTDRFRPRSGAPDGWLHREIGIPLPDPGLPWPRLVGLIARFHPQKDHSTFLAAARRLIARRPDLHFVMCGAGVESDHPLFAEAAATGRIHALGERRDLGRVLPELDVSVLSSAAGEACSLVLLESMASGVPCVTTDVGDSAYLVGDVGRVVAPRSPAALAAAIESIVDLEPAAAAGLRRRARQRAVDSFGLERVARAVEGTYADVLAA